LDRVSEDVDASGNPALGELVIAESSSGLAADIAAELLSFPILAL
jgi:hypothetical protein